MRWRQVAIGEEKFWHASYEYHSTEPFCSHRYLSRLVLRLCGEVRAHTILDLGCGNGALVRDLEDAGFDVVGCDPEPTAIEFACQAAPSASFVQAGVYSDPDTVGIEKFDAVVSTEVIEHLYAPRALPSFAYAVLKPGGYLIISTPYYGYLKNLAVVLANRWDRAHNPLWDGGHIKFWSRRTLTQLLNEGGFAVQSFQGAGRLPYLWKSMVLVARKV